MRGERHWRWMNRVPRLTVTGGPGMYNVWRYRLDAGPVIVRLYTGIQTTRWVRISGPSRMSWCIVRIRNLWIEWRRRDHGEVTP